jgi:hypothetical protein
MPCGISDVNLPSFSQERLGLLNTDRWSDPDCCDRLSIFGRLDREGGHRAPLLCHDHREEKTFRTTMFGRLLAGGSTRPLRRGRPSESASSKARSVLCFEALQHSARHEIKDFRRVLLSSRPIGKHQSLSRCRSRRSLGTWSRWPTPSCFAGEKALAVLPSNYPPEWNPFAPTIPSMLSADPPGEGKN